MLSTQVFLAELLSSQIIMIHSLTCCGSLRLRSAKNGRQKEDLEMLDGVEQSKHEMPAQFQDGAGTFAPLHSRAATDACCACSRFFVKSSAFANASLNKQEPEVKFRMHHACKQQSSSADVEWKEGDVLQNLQPARSLDEHVHGYRNGVQRRTASPGPTWAQLHSRRISARQRQPRCSSRSLWTRCGRNATI